MRRPHSRRSKASKEVAHAPLMETLHSQSGNILKLGAFVSVTALSFYTFTTYFATYMQVAGHLSRGTSLLVTVLALFFAAALCPLAGLFSDRVGRRATIATHLHLHHRLGLSRFRARWIGRTVPVTARRCAARRGRRALGRGDGPAAVGSIRHQDAIHRVRDHLQPRVHDLRRHRAARRDVVDLRDGNESVAGVLPDRRVDLRDDRRPLAARNIEDRARRSRPCKRGQSDAPRSSTLNHSTLHFERTDRIQQ